MKNSILLAAISCTTILSSFMTNSHATSPTSVQPVAYVKLERYLGKWYEIETIPAWFQKGCTFTTAEYALNEDNTLAVKNSCLIESENSTEAPKEKVALGHAWIEDTNSNAILKVSFVKIIKWVKALAGDYWILGLGPVNEQGLYSYALVGTPDRKFGWILSRTTSLPVDVLESARLGFKEQGYDLSSFKSTKQSR